MVRRRNREKSNLHLYDSISLQQGGFCLGVKHKGIPAQSHHAVVTLRTQRHGPVVTRITKAAVEERPAADSLIGTSASGSTSHSRFWCLSVRPTRGCKTHRIESRVPLARSPAVRAGWQPTWPPLCADSIWQPMQCRPTTPLTPCRISKRRRAVSRKELKILRSTEGIPTLCICSRYTTTSLYNSTSRWKTWGSNLDHQFPGAKACQVHETSRKKEGVPGEIFELQQKSSYRAPSAQPPSSWWWTWRTGWRWSRNYFGHRREGFQEAWGRVSKTRCLEGSCSVWELDSSQCWQQSDAHSREWDL